MSLLVGTRGFSGFWVLVRGTTPCPDSSLPQIPFFFITLVFSLQPSPSVSVICLSWFTRIC